ncbi:MAG: PTS sugar transporter subunit IIA, partial [bacterium]|nr:PTS sugar transporter subunit IIA [bacterium]
MIKAVIITHGNFGKELVSAVAKILQEAVDIDCFGFDWLEDGSQFIAKFDVYLEKNLGNDILIFTDMFGGSPTNICLKYSRENVEIITGVNLPGLLKYATYRNKEMSFKDIVKAVKKEA